MNLHMPNAKFGAIRPSRLVAFPEFMLRLVRLFAAVRTSSRKSTGVEINKGQSKVSPTSNETFTCNCITDQCSDMLNSPISEDEVKKAVKRLKNGKACGEDSDSDSDSDIYFATT